MLALLDMGRELYGTWEGIEGKPIRSAFNKVRSCCPSLPCSSFSGGFYFLAFWAFFAGIAVVAALRAPKRVAPAYGAVAE